MIKEFKDFIARGNVVDMAVGIIIGAAFTAIVTSLVDNLINPLIGLVLGKFNLSTLSITIANAEFKYGAFLNAVINFLLVASVAFLLVKLANRFRTKAAKPAALSIEAQYLKEIAAALKEQEKQTLHGKTTKKPGDDEHLTLE